MSDSQLKPKKIRKDLLNALQKEPFPIRGWHLSLSFSPGNPYAYPVHSSKPKIGEDGLPEEKPPVLFTVNSHELVLTADFRLEACHTLGGQKFKCPKEAADQQWIRFASTNGALEVILDTKFVPPYQEKLVYPDNSEWLSLVEHYAKKWQESNKQDRTVAWIMVQLEGIRDSANSILHQSLGRLVERIHKEIPDYWLLAELAMVARLADEEIKAANEYSYGKGALTIRTIPRPTTPATEKQQ